MKIIVALALLSASCTAHRPTVHDLEVREETRRSIVGMIRSAPWVEYPSYPSAVARHFRKWVFDLGGRLEQPAGLVGSEFPLVFALRYENGWPNIMNQPCILAELEVKWGHNGQPLYRGTGSSCYQPGYEVYEMEQWRAFVQAEKMLHPPQLSQDPY